MSLYVLILEQESFVRHPISLSLGISGVLSSLFSFFFPFVPSFMSLHCYHFVIF